jgi:ribosomal protein S12 methylthiotransferase
MRRRVSRRQIETLLAKLRGRINGLTLRTTFITGSPGETDAEHRELLRFVRDFGFDMMGVFPFSAEPGTPMGRMDGQTPDELKRQRLEELMLAQQEVAFAKARQKIGQTVDVLIDRRRAADAKNWIARSTAQAPDIDSVTYVKGDDLYAGQLLTVRIDGADGYDSLACVPQNLSQSLPILVPAVQARSI